ncbi:MAG TPA: hypothetical protein PLY23_09375 [Alphaproteobacteria bacterium]|nr:hypothetical protein [Alphaproteobacteria bacterium]HQS94864.1 hypothetical protein [Alphaproteobacteria bacterium]
MWPYFMRIRDVYTELDEEEKINGIFGGIAALSSAKYGKRNHLSRTLSCSTQIYLLKTVRDHEEFFRWALPVNGHIAIYSPFSTHDNTLARLRFLERMVPYETRVSLKVLPKFHAGLTRLLERTPGLKRHVQIESICSHQKAIILGEETICVGSLNWLSGAQSADNSYRNLELSVVLQGPKARQIIKGFY